MVIPWHQIEVALPLWAERRRRKARGQAWSEGSGVYPSRSVHVLTIPSMPGRPKAGPGLVSQTFACLLWEASYQRLRQGGERERILFIDSFELNPRTHLHPWLTNITWIFPVSLYNSSMAIPVTLLTSLTDPQSDNRVYVTKVGTVNTKKSSLS